MGQVTRRTVIAGTGAAAFSAGLGVRPSFAQEKVVKIGQLGVMSGANAAWGLTSKYSAEAIANILNDDGGVEIGGEKYRVEVVSVDDRDDPKLTVSGFERLASEGVRYVIGPNTDATAVSARPVAEKNGMIYFPYSYMTELYTAPSENVVLANFNNIQVTPVIFGFARDQRGAKKIAFLSRNTSEDLAQRDVGVKVAQDLGLEIVSKDDTYESGTSEFFPVMTNIVSKAPDMISIGVVAPATCPQIIRAARELGFKGVFAADTAQDIKILTEGAGNYADGLLSVGGAASPALRNDYMDRFIKRYSEIAGEWNEEAGTKAYALQIIVETLKVAGPDAIKDAEVFKATIPTFSVRNPFLKEDEQLTYVGEASFGQKRQIGVPLVITEVRNSAFEPVYVGKVN